MTNFNWKAESIPTDEAYIHWQCEGDNGVNKYSVYGYVRLTSAPAEGADLVELVKQSLGEEGVEAQQEKVEHALEVSV
jgi:hypothetical protein